VKKYHPNSLALLIWNVLDIIMASYKNDDKEFLENLLQWSIQEHENCIGWRRKMSHMGRLADSRRMIRELEQSMSEVNGMPPTSKRG
jgi:hypothetical protein